MNPDYDGPAGYSYAALLVRAPSGEVPRGLLDTLRGVRFSGWVGPPQDGWVPVVAEDAGTVASHRRGVVGVGEAVAGATSGAVLGIRVLHDRQLVLVAWEAGREVARYVSDPSREPGADPDVLSDPAGIEDAEAVAAVCGRPDAGEELLELLAEPLDPDEEIESERLSRVLHRLGLPTWLVSAWRLPRAVATGPATRDLVRFRAGRTDPLGWVAARVSGPVRRRQPPAVLSDPPRDTGAADDPYLWL